MARSRSRSRSFQSVSNGSYYRSMTYQNNGGRIVPEDSVDSYGFTYVSSETNAGITDVTGNYGAIDNPLEIIVDRTDGITASYAFNGVVHIWSGSATNCFVTAELYYSGAEPITEDGVASYLLKAGHLPLPELEESVNDYIVKMAKRLNPSKPAVELGVNIAEMAALPASLLRAGSILHKRVGKNPNRTVDWTKISPENPGSSYLALQYGWAPFIRDVRKLMKIVDAVEKKLSKYRRLKEHGYLRSSSKKFPEKYHQQHSETFTDALGAIWDVTTVRSTVRWCTLYYTADTDTLFDTDASSLLAARRAAYGLNLDGSTMWQVMPWSWMADWFGNFGDYIDGQRNSIGARLTKCLLMETIETETTISLVSPPHQDKIVPHMLDFSSFSNLEGGGFNVISGHLTCRFPDRTVKTVTKSRRLVTPQVEVDLALSPILGSGFRSSIIGALAIQRLFR